MSGVVEFLTNTAATLSSVWKSSANPQEILPTMTLAQADIVIHRDGQSTAATTTAASPAITVNGNGVLSIPLTASDLNFVGYATIIVSPPAALPQKFRVNVVAALSTAQLTSLGSTVSPLAAAIADVQQTADNIEADVAAIDLSDLALEETALAVRAQTDKLNFGGADEALLSESTNMRGTDNALPAASYAAPDNAGITTLTNRLTDTRATHLDKLNVSGTLAHSDAADTYKADVSTLATTSQLDARTLPAEQYFDPATDYVTVAANGISAAAMSDAAIAKIEAAFLDEEDGVAFKDALMALIEQQLDVNDLTALAIADITVTRLFQALVADHDGVSNSWGQRLSRLPNAVPGTNGGLPTVDAANRIAGLQGTISTLDQLDTAQDVQHTATQLAIAALQNLSTTQVEGVLTALGYTSTLATAIGVTNTRVDVAVSTRAVPGSEMTLTAGTINSIRSGLSTLTAAQVWEYSARSLTTFGTLVTNIWSNATRTLTAFVFTPTPSNAADITGIKTVSDRLNSMIETDAGQERFKGKALENGPSGTIVGGDATLSNQEAILAAIESIPGGGGSGGGGTATIENQQAILDLLDEIKGAGFQPSDDSLHAIRQTLRLSGLPLPEDITGDPEQDLPTIRKLLYARLMSVLASAKPNYSIDGQSVSWQGYQDMLLKQIQAVDSMIEGVNPFEMTTRARS